LYQYYKKTIQKFRNLLLFWIILHNIKIYWKFNQC
jgi:hypothetical protein